MVLTLSTSLRGSGKQSSSGRGLAMTVCWVTRQDWPHWWMAPWGCPDHDALCSQTWPEGIELQVQLWECHHNLEKTVDLIMAIELLVWCKTKTLLTDTVTHAKISPRMVNPRYIFGNTEERELTDIDNRTTAFLIHSIQVSAELIADVPFTSAFYEHPLQRIWPWSIFTAWSVVSVGTCGTFLT